LTFRKLSSKQRLIFTWPYDRRFLDCKGIIADGAVRTGKTVCMAAAFILWSMRSFSNANFGICGKTIRSAQRNILRPLEEIRDITKIYSLVYKSSESLLVVTEKATRRENRFYIFGGRDDSSYMLIQGITLSGVMFDEAALMPESFIEQAVARTLSVADAKLWFNCNPDSAHSYFYKNWIEKCREKRLLRLSLLMQDNPVLTPAQIADAESMYSGVFRDRYIYGKWVNAEGIIYREFADNPARYLFEKDGKGKAGGNAGDIIYGNIGVDFGGNGSAHAAIFAGFGRGYSRIAVLDELYIKEVITPARLEAEIAAFVLRCKESGIIIREMYCDSAEQVLIKGLRQTLQKERIGIEVKNARKGSILDRIAFENLLFSKNKLTIAETCVHLIDAFSSAVWDDSGKRLDNGATNIDSLDALEYALEPIMKNFL
jgi:PBSX family phage terminase large subunit